MMLRMLDLLSMSSFESLPICVWTTVSMPTVPSHGGVNHAFASDENRGTLLEAGFPQTVLGLLESYAESVKPAQRDPFPFSVPDLKIVKTAIGFLLNASVGYGVSLRLTLCLS